MTYKKLYTLPLLLSILTTFSFAQGEPTELKAWNLKETSVKIAFRDNLLRGGYKINIMDENGNQVTGLDESPSISNGSRDYIIRKIRGLKSGTNYQAIVVSTTQGRQTSEPLSFKTKGVSTQPTNKVIATKLKTWGVRDTSAMISFVNHAYPMGEIYFINADTKERMTLNSKGIIPVPKHRRYSIGKMIDLVPNTTYRVKIMYISIDDEWILAPSKIITFKTKE
ncbi:MAG: hypothetical protein KAG56_10740 [Sulfurovaceae bacterium]|nr:hypothetical protein [Sulfurovaceae bacterium]